MIVPSRLTIGLSVALVASLAANGFLFWQWAQAKPECVAKAATGALKATQAAEKREDGRDKTSAAIARTSDQNAAQATAQVDLAVQADKKDIHDAYFNRDPAPPAGPCLRVDPVPVGVQHAISRARSRANAAAGIVQEAPDQPDPARAGQQ